MVLTSWVFRRSTPHRVDVFFRRMQLVSAGVYSLAHGGNDAQKTMGIIVMLLIAAGHQGWTIPSPVLFHLPVMHGEGWYAPIVNFIPHWYNGLSHAVAWWYILSCHAAIA